MTMVDWLLTEQLVEIFRAAQAKRPELNAELVASANAELGAGVTPEDRMQVLLAFLARHLDQLQALIRIALEYHRHHDDPDSRAWLADITRQYVQTFQDHLHFESPAESRVMMSLLIGALVHQLLDAQSVDLLEHVHWVRRALPEAS